jgi:hypothetical protein
MVSFCHRRRGFVGAQGRSYRGITKLLAAMCLKGSTLHNPRAPKPKPNAPPARRRSTYGAVGGCRVDTAINRAVRAGATHDPACPEVALFFAELARHGLEAVEAQYVVWCDAAHAGVPAGVPGGGPARVRGQRARRRRGRGAHPAAQGNARVRAARRAQRHGRHLRAPAPPAAVSARRSQAEAEAKAQGQKQSQGQGAPAAEVTQRGGAGTGRERRRSRPARTQPETRHPATPASKSSAAGSPRRDGSADSCANSL